MKYLRWDFVAHEDGFETCSGESPIEPTTDIHAVCDLIKYWFRVLPEPVFPPSSYFQVIEAMSGWCFLWCRPFLHRPHFERTEVEDFDLRLDKIRNIVQTLPQANFDLLKRVAEHLDKYVFIFFPLKSDGQGLNDVLHSTRVTDYEEHNQMTAEALAIVFSPNLLRAPHNDFVLILANMGHTHKLVKALITHVRSFLSAAAISTSVSNGFVSKITVQCHL